jgi:hypothetical protein
MEDQFIDDSNSNSNDLLLGRVSSGACLEWFFLGVLIWKGGFAFDPDRYPDTFCCI